MDETPTPPPSDSGEAAAWIEFYYRQGWSDGLPLVPPTEASVAAMLAAGRVAKDDVIGTIAERNATLPAEKVAINAVMAGCLPEYFPVLLAAVRCLCRPEFHYHNPATSTGGSALTLIVNGMIYKMILDFSPTDFPGTVVKNHSTSSGSISSSFRNEHGITLYIIPKSFFAEGHCCAA